MLTSLRSTENNVEFPLRLSLLGVFFNQMLFCVLNTDRIMGHLQALASMHPIENSVLCVLHIAENNNTVSIL